VCIDFPNDSQVVEIAQLFPVKYGVIGWPDLFPKTAQLDTI
jgi:hypothetical protein